MKKQNPPKNLTDDYFLPRDFEIVQPIYELLELLNACNYRGGVVLKTTVLPAICREMEVAFRKLTIVANPEFLNNDTALEDTKNPRVVVVGGEKEATSLVLDAYEECGLDFYYEIFKTPARAMFVKYMINCFFVVKNAFFNEMYNTIETEDTESDTKEVFDKIVRAALDDGRIHPEHTRVPGPDGMFGFGGKCLPKDAEAFVSEYGSGIIGEAIRFNEIMRKLPVNS